jgi:hypothetical protein
MWVSNACFLLFLSDTQANFRNTYVKLNFCCQVNFERNFGVSIEVQKLSGIRMQWTSSTTAGTTAFWLQLVQSVNWRSNLSFLRQSAILTINWQVQSTEVHAIKGGGITETKRRLNSLNLYVQRPTWQTRQIISYKTLRCKTLSAQLKTRVTKKN